MAISTLEYRLSQGMYWLEGLSNKLLFVKVLLLCSILNRLLSQFWHYVPSRSSTPLTRQDCFFMKSCFLKSFLLKSCENTALSSFTGYSEF